MLERTLKISKTANVLLIIAFFVVAGALAMVAPAERSLGDYIKLIYIHAAVNWTGMILFSLAGVFGLVYLATRGSVIFNWLKAVQVTAIVVWIFHIFLGAILMRIVWNEFVWLEPRMLFAVTVLAVAALGYLISLVKENKVLISAINVIIATGVWGLLFFTTGRILHPKAAIVSSPDFTIKLFAILITLSFLAVGLGFAYLLCKRQEEIN